MTTSVATLLAAGAATPALAAGAPSAAASPAASTPAAATPAAAPAPAAGSPAAATPARAVAAGAADPVVVREGRDARAAGGPDLTRVQLGRASDGRLRGALTLAEPWTAGRLVAEPGAAQPAPPGSVCLRLWTRSATRGAPADFLVCLTATGDGERLRGSVLREAENGLLRRVGSATVGRTSTRTATLRFSQSSIGRPARVRFAAEATRAGCPRTSCVDTAPDSPQTATLVLRGAA